MEEMTAETFRKLYWKNYISIEEEFIQTERFVAFDICNYTTYSSAFLKLLLEIGSEIDILAKYFCSEGLGQNNASNINEYKTYILANAPEFERVRVVSETFDEIPWQNWNVRNPGWWTAYNKIKHERFKVGTIEDITQEYYKFANQGNVIKALMGLYQLEIYVLRALIKREGKKEGHSFLKSTLFSLDGEGWTSSSFHKDGGLFYEGGTLVFDGKIAIVK